MALGDFAGTSRFEVRRRIAAGGTGVVYEAFDRQRGESVALKALPWLEPGELYRLKREFRLLSELIHENLVRLHELFCVDDAWFFSMEFVAGRDFVSHVCQGGAPNQRRLREALRQLAGALHAVHEAGKVHRDIKPSNVLVEASGRVVLLDFGLGAELDHDTGAFEFQRVLGTPAYMAPEQAELGPVTPAADWYAVGVVLFEALTGRLPFEGGAMDMLLQKRSGVPRRPSELVKGVAADLDALCFALLAADPHERPTGPEVLRRLGVHSGTPPQSGAFALRQSMAPSGLIGRAAALASLRVAYEASRNGRSALVQVSGRSGMGKTALVRHFLAEVAARGPSVILAGRCYEHESVPYKGFDAVIDALSRKLCALAPEECAELVPRDARALACVFPVLDRVRPIAAHARGAELLVDPHQLRSRAFAALRELLGKLAQKSPVVIHIDDLQWGDADSAALLGELGAAPEPLPILLIVAYRSEDVGAQPWLAQLSRAAQGDGTGELFRSAITVDKLEPGDARELTSLLLDVPRGEPLVTAVAEESGGSPFFIEELARYAQSSEPDAAGLRLDAVLESRLKALSVPALRVLELTTVAGRPIDAALAHRVLGLGTADADAALASLCAGKLLRRGAGGADRVEPYHDRIRESVLASLAPERRRIYHERLASVLEAAGSADPDELFAHFAAAGRAAQASRYARKAADRATATLAFDRAAELYRRALELGGDGAADRQELRVLVADSLARAGRGAAAADAYALAAESEPSARALELRRKASEQLLFSGHIDRGLELVRQVLASVNMRLAFSPLWALVAFVFVRIRLVLRGTQYRVRKQADVDPALLARIDACSVVANGLSFVDNIQGKLFQARAFLDALRAGEPARIVHALAGESLFRAASGGYRALPSALALLDQAKAIVETEDVKDKAGTLEYGRGMVYHLTGNWPRASEHFSRAEQLFEGTRAGYYRVELDGAQSYGVVVLVLLGHLAQARRRHAELRREAADRNDLFLGTNLCIGQPALCWLVDDQPGYARALVAEVMARWSPAGFHLQHWQELMALTAIDLYEGVPERALERMKNRFVPLRKSMLLRIEFIRLYASYLRAACNLAMAAQTPLLARPYLRDAERDAQLLAGNGAPWALAIATLIEGSVHAQRGDQPRSLAALEAGVARCHEVGLGLFARVGERRLGELRSGSAGELLCESAAQWMAREGVKKPDQIAAMVLPFRVGR
jgi:tetratricopeptide (TPR) repeat protein